MQLEIQHNLSQQAIENYLENISSYLSDSQRALPIKLNRSWISSIPKQQGVYSIFEGSRMIYAGESGQLRARMCDLLDSRHHVLRRNLGKALYCELIGFEHASTHKKFPPNIEALLHEYIEKKLTICLASVSLGRKEIEEFLIDSFMPAYNRSKKRK